LQGRASTRSALRDVDVVALLHGPYVRSRVFVREAASMSYSKPSRIAPSAMRISLTPKH